MKFTVDRLPAVNQQIRDLDGLARQLRIHTVYLDALRGMLDYLETRPLQWGDPEYNTQQHGGVVCHGVIDPLLVHFVVFEEDQVVIITDIKPLPSSPLSLGQ